MAEQNEFPKTTSSIPTELLISITDLISSLKDSKGSELAALKSRAQIVLNDLEPYTSDSIAASQKIIEENVKKLKAEATECFKQKDFKKALCLINQSIELQPKDAIHYSNRSLANLKLKNTEEAVQDAHISITLNPKWWKGHFRLAAALKESGDSTGAFDSLNRSLEHCISPNEKETVLKELSKQKLEVKTSPINTSTTTNTINTTAENLGSNDTIDPTEANDIEKLDTCKFSWFDNTYFDSKLPLEIKTNVHGNRRFVATRNINQGELVWTESPLAAIVQAQYEDKMCHFCYNYTKPLKYKCSQCQSAYWCSMECQKQHHQQHALECRICVKTKGMTKNHQALRMIMQLLFLSVQSPKFRQMLNDLQSCPVVEEDDSSSGSNARLFGMNRNVLAAVEKFGQFGDLSKKEIMHIIGCVNVNSFVVTDLDGRRLGNALFCGGSFFNHNCKPNAVIGFDFGTYSSSSVSGVVVGGGLKLTAKSMCSIKKGEEVSISYIELFRSTLIRQRELLSSKGFQCQCLTCQPIANFIIRSIKKDSKTAMEKDQNDNEEVVNKAKELDINFETLFQQTDKAVEKALMMVSIATASSPLLPTNDRKLFDAALISIVQSFKQCNNSSLTSQTGRSVHTGGGFGVQSFYGIGEAHKQAYIQSCFVESKRWVMFELHCSVTSLLLKWPKERLSQSLAKSLIASTLLPKPSDSKPSSSNSNAKEEPSSNKAGVVSSNELLHPKRTVEYEGASEIALNALDGKHDHLHVLLYHATQALAYALEEYNAYHPRVALCRRSLGNALMLLAGSTANTCAVTSTSSTPSAAKLVQLRSLYSKRAHQEYKLAGDVIQECWHEEHPDCISIRTLQHWAKSFT